jgi:hypothetical protein
VADTRKGTTRKGGGGSANVAGSEMFKVKGNSMMNVGSKGTRGIAGIKGKVIRGPCSFGGTVMGTRVGVMLLAPNQIMLAPNKISTVEQFVAGLWCCNNSKCVDEKIVS